MGQRIREIETGKPIEETVIIRDAEEAYKKFQILICSFLDNYPVQELAEKGVKIRVIASINEENRGAKMLEHYQIKYTNMRCLRMTLIDKRHFFLFKMPPSNKETTKPMESFENTFYTNDLEYVEKMSELLNEI